MLQAGDPLPGEAPEGAGSKGERQRLDVFGAAVAEIAARVQPAYRQADGWLEQTRAGLIELLRFCDERPETARELVVESIAWGPGVLQRRGQLLDALAAALDRGRTEAGIAGTAASSSADSASAATTDVVATSSTLAEDPAGHLPSATAENLVGACISLVHTRLLQVEGGSFLELSSPLMSMISHSYLGAGAARRELEWPVADADARLAECQSQGTVARVRERNY